jgi:hypothetical protein
LLLLLLSLGREVCSQNAPAVVQVVLVCGLMVGVVCHLSQRSLLSLSLSCMLWQVPFFFGCSLSSSACFIILVLSRLVSSRLVVLSSSVCVIVRTPIDRHYWHPAPRLIRASCCQYHYNYTPPDSVALALATIKTKAPLLTTLPTNHWWS